MTTQSPQFWYQEKSDKAMASALFSYIQRLDNEQAYRQDENFKNLRLYGNLEIGTLRSYSFARAETSVAVLNRVTLNIVQSMVDTVVSKLVKNKPKPSFLTEGGDWSMQNRAKKLTQFVEGQFQATDFYSKRTDAIRNACIFGTGPLKIFRQGKTIKIEPRFVDEVIIEDADAINGDPRQRHEKKYINREVLKSMFPDKANEIDRVTNKDLSQFSSNSKLTNSDMVLVIESWKLPSGPDAKDGVHTITTNSLTLDRQEWTKNYFPYVDWKWSKRPLGYFGQGLAEQLTGLQLEINKILRTIQISMHLVSVPKLLVEMSSKVVTAHLNNKIGGIIKYQGVEPKYAALGGIPPELFSHLDRLYTRAYEIAGISQLSAQAQKPAGLDSGKALREFNDIESERFMSVGQADEDCVLKVAEQMIDLAKEIDEELRAEGNTNGYQVKVSSGTSIQFLKWADVNMEEDQYVMRIFPTSALSSTPSGRLQDVQELIQAGFVSKEDGMKLLDFPDLRQFMNFANAGVENIDQAIEQIIDHGRYETPEPYQNLNYGIQRMQQAYLMYKSNNAPESRLELFRRWIEDAGALLSKAAQANALPPAPEAGPALPPAPPEAGQIPQNIQAAVPGPEGTVLPQ